MTEPLDPEVVTAGDVLEGEIGAHPQCLLPSNLTNTLSNDVTGLSPLQNAPWQSLAGAPPYSYVYGRRGLITLDRAEKRYQMILMQRY